MGEVCINWKKANCAPILKKDKKDNPEKAVNQPCLSCYENHGIGPLGTYFWAHKGEGDWE